jgi:hypothetical protein
VVLISAASNPAKLSPEEEVLVPPAAPMRVLEVLQAQKSPEPICVLPFYQQRTA